MYAETEPYASGWLSVGDGNQVYWEVCGNPEGKPAVCLHGGPGSGCAPWWRRFFDPNRYRIVLLDQRGCGRSTPSAADPGTDLSVNTTQHLIADIELLRKHLNIEKWLIFGGSWGSTLGLAYAQAHPERASELVLFSVVTTTAREAHWVTGEMGRIFPEEWQRFVEGVPPDQRDGNLPAAYARLLADPDPAVRDRAALGWCAWEDTHVATHPGHRPDPRYEDPAFRYLFARLVTHYWANAAFIPDGALQRGVARIAHIPAVLVTGRLDVSGPPDIAWRLARDWPGARLVLVDEGHGARGGIATAVVDALDDFAGPAAMSGRGPS
jgi:proline iminopeptidase